MMFTSTVVSFVEFTMLSLLGFMIYRLYASYSVWKKASTFSQSKSSQSNLNAKAKPAMQKVSDFSSGTGTLDYLASKNINVSEEKTNLSESRSDKKSSAILNDYIGEFFTESLPVDIEHYRSQSIDKAPMSDLKGALSSSPEANNEIATDNNEVNEDVILVSSFVAQNPEEKSGKPDENMSSEEMIPTLLEINDIDADTIITVDSLEEEAAKSNKVMSDKVVLAMLDEAKIVCAS